MMDTPTKQVSSSHYAFDLYLDKPRWTSVWHQLDEVLKLRPGRVLEVGPGPGVFKQVAAGFGVRVETIDIDPELGPDHVGSATSLPFVDDTFDVVCAFQMLEHLPFDVSMKAFGEMMRVAQRHVVISLPDAQPAWRYMLHVPLLGQLSVTLRIPFWKAVHRFDGEHYWEINKKGYALARVVRELEKYGRLAGTYRVPENAYHRFFVFDKRLQADTAVRA
jgi:hypothetical protein